MSEVNNNSLHDLMKSGRKFGATSYSYSAKHIKEVDGAHDSGKVAIIARNNITGELVMSEKFDSKDVVENGLPLPLLTDLNNEN